MLHLYVAPEGEKRRVWLFDVSAQKSMELQLSQAQKMQAVGQLAGGVAHDFNNLLTAIQLQLSGLLERHPVGDPSYEGLNEIRQTAIRAADLVRKLLAFSRKSTVRRERLDLGELVGEFAVLLRRLLREDVRLETDYGRDLPVVLADKSQLETAVMNLAVNARDAMRGVVAPGDAVVTITTRRLTRDQAKGLGWLEVSTDDAAMIEVSDTGPGVPAEIVDKIFEPFFTTKAVNEGTGMGLATVYGIVQQAGGHITVANIEGAGAAFRIFLPAAGEAELAEAPPVEVKTARQPRDLSGAGRILFVEDEAAVRGIAARLLRQRGYDVIEAADGEEALLLAEEHAGTIDMLISDVIMPGLDGPSLLKKARQYLGDAPVMFISGYAESDFSDLLQDETGVSFLPKPLDIKTLAERVKQELHAA
jgi:two-component system cell cycle sensor histidine kinase/response regulator CckA